MFLVDLPFLRVVWVCGFVSLVLILFVKAGLAIWVCVVDVAVFVIF